MELVVVEGPDEGRAFTLGQESVLGRDPTASLNLADEEVSRRHAIVTAGDGNVTVEDLGSSNGTFVDEHRIDGEARMQPGQRLRVGQTVLELRPRGGQDADNMPATKVPLPELGDSPPE
jgi:pSer/pThr/pTyr-binding forkhead associated (FHA) protein